MTRQIPASLVELARRSMPFEYYQQHSDRTRSFCIKSEHIVSESYRSGSGLLLREKADGVYTDYVYDDYGTNKAVYTAGADPENEKGYLSMSLN